MGLLIDEIEFSFMIEHVHFMTFKGILVYIHTFVSFCIWPSLNYKFYFVTMFIELNWCLCVLIFLNPCILLNQVA